MHTRRVLSAHGACSGSLCTGNREGKRGPVLFHLFQLEGNGGRQQRRNRSQRNHTRTDAVGPAQGACRGNRSTKSAEEPKCTCQTQSFTTTYGMPASSLNNELKTGVCLWWL